MSRRGGDGDPLIIVGDVDEIMLPTEGRPALEAPVIP
jgi:hypothetical protein